MKNFILIDDDSIFNILNGRLIKAGYTESPVSTFTIAKTALEHVVSKICPDRNLEHVILLDINMPIMNGFEFLEALSQVECSAIDKIKVIIVTSSSDENDKQRAMAYPFVTEVLRKPLTRQALDLAVSKERH